MFIAKQLRPFLRLEGKVILFILFHLLFLNGEDNFAIKEQTRVLGQLKDVFFAYVITRTKVSRGRRGVLRSGGGGGVTSQ